MSRSHAHSSHGLKAHVLLTGVTGFVGKVVLSDLMRRKDELNLGSVTVLVRHKKARDGKEVSPADRFAQKVAPAKVFEDLPEGWLKAVEVVAGDLEKPHCGLSPEDLSRVQERTTHVVHCAASVEFDLPIQEAASANITSALGVLELARTCTHLQAMVDTSTAYVTTWRDGPIVEQLAHLPRPAQELLDAIQSGTRTEAELLEETGHPNTYTYTKCIAEHLLCQRRGDVPLVIVRPSIISASWKDPFAGWIDSPAALAGCLLYTALGVVPAFHGHPGTRLDVIPVDIVSRIIIDAGFKKPLPAPGEPVPIRYAAAGVENAIRIDSIAANLLTFFKARPGQHKLDKVFVGTVDHGHTRRDMLQRAVPNEATRIVLEMLGQSRDLKRLTKMNETVGYLHKAFSYFTYHTFDFRPAEPLVLENYTPDRYMEVICRGIYRHLFKKDETEVSIAGADHEDARDDFRWALEKPDGNWSIRVLGIGMRKTLRRCTESVTWDRPSFERAVEAAPANAIFILAPSHRSYLDFLLTSYVCFQHPELGIPVPHVAAADDFSRIPVVGQLLAESRAFYIPRGVGTEVPQVSEQLRRVVQVDGSLMFFVEGQRSRSRMALPPKRGLLRGLQATGRTFVILPIAMSYDRIPEEGALEKELAGGEKPGMSLRATLGWLTEMARKKVQLGRVHMACGAPLHLDAFTDVRTLSQRMVAEQQNNTAATRFHLRTFLAHANLKNVNEDWLAAQIGKRGGRVLESKLPAVADCSPALEQSLRNQWMHWFFADARALYPDDPVVADHVERHSWAPVPQVSPPRDERVHAVVDALFEPIRADYALTARALRGAAGVEKVTPRSIVKAHPSAHLPVVEDAFRLLTDSGVLRKKADGTTTWGDHADRLGALLNDWTAERSIQA